MKPKAISHVFRVCMARGIWIKYIQEPDILRATLHYKNKQATFLYHTDPFNEPSGAEDVMIEITFGLKEIVTSKSFSEWCCNQGRMPSSLMKSIYTGLNHRSLRMNRLLGTALLLELLGVYE